MFYLLSFHYSVRQPWDVKSIRYEVTVLAQAKYYFQEATCDYSLK